MTKREIASLVIKLMGVFILIKSISYVPMGFGSIFSAAFRTGGPGVFETMMVLIMVLVMIAIPLLWSLFIIVRSDKVAAWLIKEDNDKLVEVGSSVSKDDVMLVVCSCIGLYLIVTAFPNMIVNCSHFLTVHRAGSEYVSYTSGVLYKTINLIAPAVKIALGVWLFAGAKGIVKFWHKISR
ncbi:MAG: hypothetical protein H8E62_01820 [Planctomycetes bacterium]|nr:hypothetical protein [Planctomycetota bacterium]